MFDEAGYTEGIYHDHIGCENGIEKICLGIPTWYHEACRVMTNSDPMGQIFFCFFLSHPHKKIKSFSCSSLKIAFLCLKERLLEVSDYDEMQNNM